MHLGQHTITWSITDAAYKIFPLVMEVSVVPIERISFTVWPTFKEEQRARFVLSSQALTQPMGVHLRVYDITNVRNYIRVVPPITVEVYCSQFATTPVAKFPLADAKFADGTIQGAVILEQLGASLVIDLVALSLPVSRR